MFIEAGVRPLPRRQAEMLAFIKDSLSSRGIPPTVAEIAKAQGYASTHVVRQQLKALARKGVIELIPSVSRGIRVIEGRESGGLPVVGRVAAGSPILAIENIEGYVAIDPNVFSPPADFLLRVEGMSLRDARVVDGDLLAVHKTPEPVNGRIVIARWDDECTAKRLRLRGHTAWLEPRNPEYETIKLDLRRTKLHIEGWMVGSIHRETFKSS